MIQTRQSTLVWCTTKSTLFRLTRRPGVRVSSSDGFETRDHTAVMVTAEANTVSETQIGTVTTLLNIILPPTKIKIATNP